MAKNEAADDFGCGPHHAYAGGHRKHPDYNWKEPNKGYSPLQPHERGVSPPGRHSEGKLPSQMNPDHGPHRGAGRQR